ncbi:MAG: hypothetical protein AB1453_03590 [Chloroflexota bacterium]|jgi:hypothetical protein
MMKKFERIVWLLLFAAYTAYAALFIARTIFYVNGIPYAALFDDMMISMTYARNLAQGHGLVWNPGGERVEGFSNPLWVGLMALFHLLPIAENWISLAVQISGGIFFIASLLVLRKVAQQVAPGAARVALLAVLLTAFYYPLSNWSLLGLEVSLLLLMVNAAMWLALRVLESGRFSRGLYLLMGVATLVRVDAAVTYLTIWGLLVWFDKANRRRHLLEGGLLLGLFIGGQTLARKLYYGEWVPNTYTLKVEGLPLWALLRRGVIVLWNFLKAMFLPLAVFPLTVLLFRRDRKVLLVGLVFLAQVAYNVYVGGDAWEHRGGANRFIALGMPAFMLLFSLAAWHWYDALTAWLVKRLPGAAGAIRILAVTGMVGFVILSMLMWNRFPGNYGIVTSLRQPAEGELRFFFLLDRSIYVPGNERYTRDALLIRQVTKPEASVAMVAAGNICYFSHRTCIDLLGKSDPVVARAGVQVPFDADWKVLRPGHIKFNYAYSISQLKPDVIVEVLVSTGDVAEPHLRNYKRVMLNRHPTFFLKESPFVDWEKLEYVRED